MNKIEQVINIEWNTSKADQKYLKTLQDTHHQLDTLKADPSTPKMIRKVICAIEKHAELEKAGERLEKKTEAQQQIQNNVKEHFSTKIWSICIDPATTKKEIGYANKVVEEKIEEMSENTNSQHNKSFWKMSQH